MTKTQKQAMGYGSQAREARRIAVAAAVAAERARCREEAEAVAAGYAGAVERAVAAERARCVAVCREVAAQHWATGKGGATECAEAIERGEVGR